MDKKFFALEDLEAYKLAKEYSKNGWTIYEKMTWQTKKILGDQMITSIDSVGANIAEGYGRFHYLDKNKFYYNARGSLLESQHWIALLLERGIINQETLNNCANFQRRLLACINAIIRSQYNQKAQEIS